MAASRASPPSRLLRPQGRDQRRPAARLDFAPIHWSNSNASSACIGDLVSPQTDPFSGQPESKATPVSIERADFAYRGFALAHEPFAFPEGTRWSQVALPGTTGFLFASNDTPDGWRNLAPSLFPD